MAAKKTTKKAAAPKGEGFTSKDLPKLKSKDGLDIKLKTHLENKRLKITVSLIKDGEVIAEDYDFVTL